MTRFRCEECGGEHDLDEMSLVAHEPAQWLGLDEAGRARSVLTRDQCILRSEQETAYFVAARLLVPVRGTAREYSWGVWVSLSETSFAHMERHWEDPQRVALAPSFGWLCTALPGYPDTMFLKTMVHQSEVGVRPWVELEPTGHPLAVHQREGIDAADLFALLHTAMQQGREDTQQA